MKVLKFGGKSLDNGQGIKSVLDIIVREKAEEVAPLVVVSARGNATDTLIALVQQAQKGESYQEMWQAFCEHQQGSSQVDLSAEIELGNRLLSGIALLRECSLKTMDAFVSIGEVMAAKYVAHALNARGCAAVAIDAGDLLVTDSQYGNAAVDLEASQLKTCSYLKRFSPDIIAVVTGFIARDYHGDRTTLGRNGSNYTAALLANFLDAQSMANYTHVNGIFTANPSLVSEAIKIDELSYADAAELSQFGAEILHTKTIEPLQKKGIPLRVLNTFTSSNGTLVTAQPKEKDVRAIASLPHKALIHFEGKNMLGCIGIDARIFAAFARVEVSVGLISQGSTERGIAIVVDEANADVAVGALTQEFRQDLAEGAITNIYSEKGLAIVAIIGMKLSQFDRPYKALVRNRIVPLLLNNTVPDNTLCLLVRDDEVVKALNVIHGEMFEHAKRIHLAVIGHGAVGGALIDQILEQRTLIHERKNIDLRIFAIANSKSLLLAPQGQVDEISGDWRTLKNSCPDTTDIVEQIINFAREHMLENTILVDNTSSVAIAQSYELLARNGFDIVSSNKKSNTASWYEYTALRETLKRCRRSYRYETNVGAGLPLIDNLRLLHLSGERITRIHGLFSGSLSYIFNTLGEYPEISFHEVLQESARMGYTEPDPREDLSGEDVVRKVLILARELDVPAEMSDVEWHNPIPVELRALNRSDFERELPRLELEIEALRQGCASDEVLRYVGDVIWDDRNGKAYLSAGLKRVPRSSPLGSVRGADSCFEIYTESYGSRPIVIQGAGAGAVVTARGVFGDLLRLAEGYED